MRAVFVGVFLATAGVVGTVGTSWAQAPRAAVEIHRDLLRQLRAVQFSVSAGRIAASSQLLDRSGTSSARQGDREERLAINLTTGQPSFSYEARDPHARLVIELDEGQSLLIEQRREEEPATLFAFEQRPHAQLIVRSGPADGPRLWRASTLWHLLLAEPELCRDHLLPVLRALRPDWDLAGFALRVEESLVRAASNGRVPDRKRWTTLVAQLASPVFSERQAADRHLRLAGQAIVPFLQGQDVARLDAEQRFRLRQIVAALANDAREDQPQAVASWLVADPRVWFGLLSRADPALRALASEQLRRLADEPIDFDPLADDATRAAQLEALRARFLPASEPVAAPNPSVPAN